jgi:hypothetical protein
MHYSASSNGGQHGLVARTLYAGLHPMSHHCIICRKPFASEDKRHNAEPVISGWCCESCSIEYVIPRRIRFLECGERN